MNITKNKPKAKIIDDTFELNNAPLVRNNSNELGDYFPKLNFPKNPNPSPEPSKINTKIVSYGSDQQISLDNSPKNGKKTGSNIRNRISPSSSASNSRSS